MISQRIKIKTHRILIQAATYFSVGSIATLIHYAVFVTLLTFTSAVLASFIGSFIGTLTAYSGHKSYTFLTNRKNKLKANRFFFVALNYNAINFLLMWILTEINNFQPFISQLSITTILGMLSFIINRSWSYKSKYVYENC